MVVGFLVRLFLGVYWFSKYRKDLYVDFGFLFGLWVLLFCGFIFLRVVVFGR